MVVTLRDSYKKWKFLTTLYTEAVEGRAMEGGDDCAPFSLLLYSPLVPPGLCPTAYSALSLVRIIIAIICKNRMVTRLEENIGKCAGA
jgi:hypothetical protein